MSSPEDLSMNRSINDPADSSVNVDANESGILDQSSFVDVAQSASIRSSRRRMKKGSAVVLNTDRLQKYIQKDPTDSNTSENSLSQILDFKEQYLQKMSPIRAALDPRISEFRRNVLAGKLQRWWRLRLTRRFRNYTQLGAWNSQRSDLIFGLILGYRARKVMRSTKLVANIKAQQDVHRILSDMCSTVVHGGDTRTGGDKWEIFRLELESHDLDHLLLRYPSLSHTDMILAKSMCRQLLSERQKLHLLVFGGSCWRHFPSPGFWDLGEALRKARVAVAEKEHRQSLGGHNNADSPARGKVLLHKGIMETPPNMRHAVKIANGNSKPLPRELNLSKNNSHLAEDSSREIDSAGNGRATPPLGMQLGSRGSQEEGLYVTRLRHSGDRPERSVDPHLLVLSPETERALNVSHVAHVAHVARAPRELGRSPAVSASLASHSSAAHSTAPTHVPAARPSTSHAHSVHSLSISNTGSSGQKAKPETQSSQACFRTERKRDSNKGHLQLHIISGEKLMAARKGAPLRDALGGAVPDRIPCLKVKLMLPNWTAGVGTGGRGQPSPDPLGAQGLKKVYEKIKDYTVTTLNPQWGATFTLNFPTPRHVVQNLAAELKVPLHDAEGQLSDAAFESLRRGLLQWWSLGVVNIEVFDGERFNQEIFMGQFDLLLNGFMVLIKKPDDLEMKGNFQLCKLKPTDRVSGCIKVQAYLHPPEKTYLAELLDGGMRVSQSQAPDAHEREAFTKEDNQDTDERGEENDNNDGRASPELYSSPASASADSPSDTTNNNTSTSANNPNVVYSSRFMQTLLRNSKQQGALTDSSPPPPPPATSAQHTAFPQVQHTKATSDMPPPPSSFVSRFASSTTEGSELFLRDPQLEESENIRFNVQGGKVVSQMNISESARLLKEKLRRGRASQRGKTSSSSALHATEEEPEEADTLETNVVIPQYGASSNQPQAPLHHHRAQSASAIAAASSHHALPQGDSHINSVGVSKSMKASKDHQSVDSSALRRNSMADVSKRLAGLSALQYSTDAVLDNLNTKLEAKLRIRESLGGGDAHYSSQRPSSASASPTKSKFSQPYGQDAEKLEEYEEEDEEGANYGHDETDEDRPFNMPDTAELRRAMLQSSFRSSRSQEAEDEDAPEMDVESAEDSYASDHFHDAFEDTYEGEGDEEGGDQQDYDDDHYDDNDNNDNNNDDERPVEILDRKIHNREAQVHALGVKHKNSEYSSDGFSEFSFSEGGLGLGSHGGEGRGRVVDHAEVPVMAAQRRYVNPAAHRDAQPVLAVDLSGAHSIHEIDTIYLDESEEEMAGHRGGYDYDSQDEAFNSEVDETKGAVYNNSTFSSDYSENIQEFLSPTPSSAAFHRHHAMRDDRLGDSDEELIVMDSGPSTLDYSEYGSPVAAARGPAKGHSHPSPRLFEVQSAQGSSSMKAKKSSPSRSLFEAHRADEEVVRVNKPASQASSLLTSPPRRERQPLGGKAGDGAVPSPRREQIRRVVLELDDLDL